MTRTIELTEYDQWMLRQALGNEMSAISELCHCAGWMSGCEDEIPRLCKLVLKTGDQQRYGMFGITPAMAMRLVRLAELAGGWAKPSADGLYYDLYEPKGA